MKRLLKLYDEKDFHPIGTIDLADIAGGDNRNLYKIEGYFD